MVTLDALKQSCPSQTTSRRVIHLQPSSCCLFSNRFLFCIPTTIWQCLCESEFLLHNMNKRDGKTSQENQTSHVHSLSWPTELWPGGWTDARQAKFHRSVWNNFLAMSERLFLSTSLAQIRSMCVIYLEQWFSGCWWQDPSLAVTNERKNEHRHRKEIDSSKTQNKPARIMPHNLSALTHDWSRILAGFVWKKSFKYLTISQGKKKSFAFPSASLSG